MTMEFQKYLQERSESNLFSGKGDEAYSGLFYLANAADTFFTIGARKLVEDGLKDTDVAWFLISAAHDILQHKHNAVSSREKAKATDDELLKLVLQIVGVADEIPNKAS